jgi:hypothetical protein
LDHLRKRREFLLAQQEIKTVATLPGPNLEAAGKPGANR